MRSEKIEYREGDVLFEAHAEWDEGREGKRPAVLVAHAWSGQSDFERGWARSMAELGYAGVALDVFGKGVRGTSLE